LLLSIPETLIFLGAVSNRDPLEIDGPVHGTLFAC
jgi:hypothetical protein